MMPNKLQNGVFRVFFDMSTDLMILVGAGDEILEANGSWCRGLGLSLDGCLGRVWRDFLSPRDQDRTFPGTGPDAGAGTASGLELALLHQDGTERPVLVFMQPAERPDQRCLVFRDLTLMKRFEEELRRVQLMDELSGALSRRHFLNRSFEELLRSVRYQSDMTLLLIDIDGLGGVNERHGQYKGDQIIRRVARICMKKLRNTDLFGSLGGGTFAALLVETPLSGARVIAERLREFIALDEVFLDGVMVAVTVSQGLCGREAGDVSIEEMLGRAESLLRRAKMAGGNCVIDDLQ
jgi:diguanylate cyclase (GGDEF)-like protein/PAS domain S-box-containing protein